LLSQEVSNWVLGWFASRGKLHSNSQEALGTDYLQAGLLTSLEIVEFIAQLEDHFGIQFSEADLQDSRFPTIGGVAELVVAALSQTSKAGEIRPSR